MTTSPGTLAIRRVPLIANGDGWWSFLHIDDAAEATALAVERGNAGSIYGCSGSPRHVL